MPQEIGVYKNFSARKFLKYIAALKGITGKVADKKIEELLDLVGLKDVGRKKLGGFSGGMLRRIGIAQTLLNDPQIVILEEPTAGLDPVSYTHLHAPADTFPCPAIFCIPRKSALTVGMWSYA